LGPHPLQVKSAKNGRKLRILSGLCQEFWNLKEADGRKLESPARQPQRYGPGSGCCGRFDFHRYRRRLWTRDLDWLRENIARSFLGIAACSQGKRVRFHTTTGLVTQLLEAREERTLQRLHKQLERQDVNQCLAAPADSQRSLDPNPGWAIGPFVKASSSFAVACRRSAAIQGGQHRCATQGAHSPARSAGSCGHLPPLKTFLFSQPDSCGRAQHRQQYHPGSEDFPVRRIPAKRAKRDRFSRGPPWIYRLH